MYIHHIVIVAVAIVAAVTDYRTLRIPNWLTLGGIAAGLALAAAGQGVPGGLDKSVVGMLWGGLFLLPLFLMNAMGGGDVKLAAAFGALGGAYFAVNMLLVGSLFGGIWAAIQLLRIKGFQKAYKSVCGEVVKLALIGSNPQADNNGPVMPYGVSLSLGALTVLLFLIARGDYPIVKVIF